MADPSGDCPLCKAPIERAKMRYEQYVVGQDGTIHGAQRTFLGICPTHGEVFVLNKMGHHSTLGEKEIDRRYPKAVRLRINRHLRGDDRRLFNRALRGLHKPSPEQIRRWDRMAIEVEPSTVSRWFGSAHKRARP